MSFLFYTICVIVAVLSVACIYIIICTKSKKIWLLMPAYMVLILALAIYKQEPNCFGLIGIIGVVPALLLFKKKWLTK